MKDMSEEKKTILYLSVYDPHVPLTGGGARGGEFVNYLAQAFHLDLAYIDGSGQPAIPELSRKYESRLKGVESKFCVPFSQMDYFLFSTKLYSHAKSLLKEKRYDYILCDYGLSAVYGLILSRKFNVPFIYCSHNLEYRQYLGKAAKDPRRYPLALYVYLVEMLGVKKSKILVPIAKGDAAFYERWVSPEKMLVIPQGFDINVFNPFYDQPKNDRKIVLFCGNFKIPTNVAVVHVVMERILERVIKECPNTLFRFVGAQPPTDIKHPNVEFLGFVEDYPSLLKNADVVISPMQRGWGFPTKIVEALACGKTTITTPVGGRALESDLESLHVVETEDFAPEIVKALKSGQSVSQVDFQKVKERYSWAGNIQKLVDRINGNGSGK